MSPLPYSRGRDVRNAYHEIIGSYETFVTLSAPPASRIFLRKVNRICPSLEWAFVLTSDDHYGRPRPRPRPSARRVQHACLPACLVITCAFTGLALSSSPSSLSPPFPVSHLAKLIFWHTFPGYEHSQGLAFARSLARLSVNASLGQRAEETV